MMQSTSYSTPFATTPFGVIRSTPCAALTSTSVTFGRLKVGRYSSLKVGRLQNCRYQGFSASAVLVLHRLVDPPPDLVHLRHVGELGAFQRVQALRRVRPRT